MSYTLHLGDCLTVLPTLAANSIDAIITDLPYGTTACKWDEVIPFAPMWEQVKRILKPHGAFVTTASQPFTSALVMSNAEWFRHSWIWDKQRHTGGANADKAPMRAHEDICVFARSSITYHPQMSAWTIDEIKRLRKNEFLYTPKSAMGHRPNIVPSRDESVQRGRYPGTVIRIAALGSIDPERADHPTQKPVALYAYLIRTYTNPGDTVLDFCAGSGTTGVAAIKEGRNFVGVELDADYFKIAEKRISEAAMQPMLLEVA